MSSPDSSILEIKLDEPVCTSNLRKNFDVPYSIGVQRANYTTHSATSNTTVNNIQWQIPVPMGDLVSDIIVRLPCRWTVTGTPAAGEKLLPDGLWCMSQYAFYKLIDTAQLSINGHTMTKNLNDIMPVIKGYIDGSVTKAPKLASQFAAPDRVQSYNSYYDEVPDAEGAHSVGGSPFTPAKWSVGDVYSSRVPKITTTIGNAVNGTSAVIEFDMFISLPFDIFGANSHMHGIANINQLTVTLNCNTRYSECFSLLPHLIGRSFSLAFSEAPEIHVQHVTPKSKVYDDIRDPSGIGYLPQSYPMARHMPHWKDYPNVAVGASVPMNSGVITLNTFPSRLYIVAERKRDNPLIPEVYGLLDDLAVSFNGLSTVPLKTHALYHISTTNGLKHLDYYQALETGFAVCLDLENGDLGLGDNYIGQNASVPLTVTASCKNISRVVSDYRFHVVPEFKSYLEIRNTSAQMQDVLTLTEDQRAQLNDASAAMVKEGSKSLLYGGSIFGTILRTAKNVGRDLMNPQNLLKIGRYLRDKATQGAGMFQALGGSGGFGGVTQSVTAGKRGGAITVETTQKAGGIVNAVNTRKLI